MKNIRLGFYYHVPAISRGDDIYMPGYLGRFIDSLADYCGKVICFLHSPRLQEASLMDYRVVAKNVKLIDIGPHASVMQRTLRPRLFTSPISAYAAELDILLIRGPTPLLPALAKVSSIPIALLLVGDYVTGVNDLPQPRWRKELIRVWSHWNKWGQKRATRQGLTFVNSRVLYNELKGKTPNLHEVRTTTLNKGDFYLRPNTCLSKPYRLLYVGRMDRSKGLLQMAEAVSILVERGEDVTLDLVGWQEHGDPICEEIRMFANAKNVADRIRFLGPHPVGPELFKYYQQADIFLIASFASEGFPRTIWEAMANSLPVIATKVGSIPAFIEGAAELIPPGRVEALADAVAKLIHHPEVRQNLILRGLELAQKNTLEIQVGAMVA